MGQCGTADGNCPLIFKSNHRRIQEWASGPTSSFQIAKPMIVSFISRRVFVAGELAVSSAFSLADGPKDCCTIVSRFHFGGGSGGLGCIFDFGGRVRSLSCSVSPL